jgi:hypothetical protein
VISKVNEKVLTLYIALDHAFDYAVNLLELPVRSLQISEHVEPQHLVRLEIAADVVVFEKEQIRMSHPRSRVEFE